MLCSNEKIYLSDFKRLCIWIIFFFESQSRRSQLQTLAFRRGESKPLWSYANVHVFLCCLVIEKLYVILSVRFKTHIDSQFKEARTSQSPNKRKNSESYIIRSLLQHIRLFHRTNCMFRCRITSLVNTTILKKYAASIFVTEVSSFKIIGSNR